MLRRPEEALPPYLEADGHADPAAERGAHGGVRAGPRSLNSLEKDCVAILGQLSATTMQVRTHTTGSRPLHLWEERACHACVCAKGQTTRSPAPGFCAHAPLHPSSAQPQSLGP